MDPISYVLAMIEIAAADAAHSTIMSVNNSLFCNGILKFGTEEQKQKYVRAIAEGREIGAFALTEPQSGSDATAMRCKATKQADGTYVINGKKSWITSGPVAKYIVLFAMTEPDKGARGITAFMVDTDKRRLPPRQDRAQARHPRLGHLRDRVRRLRRRSRGRARRRRPRLQDRDGRARRRPHRHRLAGDRHRPRRLRGDAGVREGAQGLRRADRHLPDDPGQDRRHEVQARRGHAADAARGVAEGRVEKGGARFSNEAAIAKLTASEAAMWITHQAVQIHGGMGYSKEMPLERYFRDAKITEIYEGTSEIQRLVIARNETGLR